MVPWKDLKQLWKRTINCQHTLWQLTTKNATHFNFFSKNLFLIGPGIFGYRLHQMPLLIQGKLWHCLPMTPNAYTIAPIILAFSLINNIKMSIVLVSASIVIGEQYKNVHHIGIGIRYHWLAISKCPLFQYRHRVPSITEYPGLNFNVAIILNYLLC